MAWLEQLYLGPLILFTLVLARVSALVMTAPIFATREAPMQARGLLAVMLAVLITPLQLGTAFVQPTNLVDYVILLAGEAITGLTLGLGLMILFSGIQLTGLVIAQMSGMALADVFNPGVDAEVPVFSHLLYYVTLAVFVTIGGHHLVIESLLNTFAELPPGTAAAPRSLAESVTLLLSQSFVLGVRAAAPILVALLLATIVMGLISRAMPQLNILAVGFGINTFATLGSMLLALGSMAWVFQQHLEPALDTLLSAFRAR